VGLGVGVAVGLGLEVGVGVTVAVGVGVGVGGGPDWAQYLPPVLVTKLEPSSDPPQAIISLPVHTAVEYSRPDGALLVLVIVQLSALGLYLPPVFNLPESPKPPQMIISLPVQTAV
jgi:hypothetical protein